MNDTESTPDSRRSDNPLGCYLQLSPQRNPADGSQTTHDWIRNLEFGKIAKAPLNMTLHDVRYYAYAQFSYSLLINKQNHTVTRYCPACQR